MHIGILGGGPSGMFLYKRLIESGVNSLKVTIFEKRSQLGSGMPYSTEGANNEHVTNVSGNEIPELVTSIKEWITSAPSHLLQRFDIAQDTFSEYKVLPRLLFGEYLSAQFELLQQSAVEKGIVTEVLLNTMVTDVIDLPEEKQIKVLTNQSGSHKFDAVIISTGHNWPRKHEGQVPNYFDSPYPPSKLALKVNYPIAIRGSSLTAIDALKTVARHNGKFHKNEDSSLSYQVSTDSPDFKLVMHSIDGLLPAIRFHLEDSNLSSNNIITEEEMKEIMASNDGFIPLDYIFERNFKQAFREQEPEFYEKIREMRLEEFVELMMRLRERLDPFLLFKAEYAEAGKSIKRKQSVYWKEMLAVLSFATNFPAKHLSAEDMIRLKKTLMPLISIVIAFVPQSSCREVLALHEAGILSLVPVDRSSKVLPQQQGGALYQYTDHEGKEQSVYYKLFIDCIGQPHLSYEDFPFKSLLSNGNISPARLRFKSNEEGLKAGREEPNKVEKDLSSNYYLQVPGITINDNFQVLDKYGAYSDRIYIMAVPYIGGYNPDYSGLDFCEAASARIIKALSQAAVPAD